MADDDAAAAAALGTRWTCEACGCHTNTEAEDAISCGVCGTRRAPSLLRRNQSRPLSRNFNPDDSSPSSPSSHSSHSSHSSPSDHSDDDASTSSPIENDDTLVLEAARIADAASPLRHSRAAAARRLLRPGTSGVLLQRHPVRPRSSSRPTTDPETLRTLANGNAGEYLPRWSVRHKGGSIVVDEEDHPHVAHLSEVGEEGRCVRALHPLPAPAARPRHRPGGSPPPAAEGSRKRGVYGWKVVFEHSSRDRGKSMGGCYLVGVTTHAFASFGERSGLQQSRLFWGIEDGGRRYEGGGRRQGAVAGGSPHGIQLNRAEAPRNSDNVLFGSREVVTVVADLEARTLTYWRDGRLLGTLVTGLPRAGSLYPVAVPFNAGVSVAITGLEGDPLGMLSRFHTAQRAALEAKNQARRVTLANQKSLLIENGALTEALAGVLREIFGWYGGETLDALAAARLWYRCGLRLSHLSVLLEGRDSVGVEDFMTIIEKIVEEEESGEGRKVDVTEAMDTSSSGGESDVAPFAPTFEVGDKVEVAEGYEKYGDAASGPLRPGDRGSVMEVQRGPRGDRQSVRVVFNGRRWWYQPQALLSERSGLVESPAVRLLLNILRRHGYDSKMEPLWDRPLTSDSWKIGDLVVTAPDATNDDRGWGRIVPDTTAGRRDAGLVMVDFSRSRGGAKRVKVSTLHHTTFHHGRHALPHSPSPPPSDDESSTSPPPRANAHLLQTIRGVSQLDNTAMTALLSECRTSASLAGLFAAGLPDAILSALDAAGSHEGDVAPRLATLGNLCVAVVTQLFHDGPTTAVSPPETGDPPVLSPRAENPRTNTTTNNNNNNEPPPRVNVRDLMRDLGRGAEQRRGVLLALMASARMSDDGRGMDDDHLSRGRHLLSSFGRLSADAAAFGVLPSPPSLPPDDPPGEAVVGGGSLLSSVLRGGSPVAGTTAPPLRRSISSSTKSLIHDGLLLDDLHWVKKALHAGADPPTARDDDDTPLLRLAISLGCRPPLLSALIKAGSTVTSRDIETAAVTNQPPSLALLLRHAVYTPGRIPWERCSPAIRETLSAAEETQKKQEATMKEAAGDFCQEVLRRFVALALQCALDDRKGAARCLAETLVGEVLLSAMHEGQGGTWGGVVGTEDGRVPALETEGRSLLEALPEGVVRRALMAEEEESLVTYLRLTEYYMWSKTMRDAAVGLTLAVMLLRKAPGLCDEMTRFGMKELAGHHVTLADENLADLAVGSECPPVVKCPQGHTTILHLTRHSSFRCDLCGKGVEQNKPMHGCRDCDWDACECCTDKAEGGLVKWSHIRSLAVEVGGMVSEEGDEEQEGEGEELVRVCRAILERDERGVDGLRAMLDVPGRVTLYEFASCVLPSLYFAMVGERNGMRRNDVNLCLMKPTRRRNKKPRVRRGKTSLVKRFDNEGGYFMNYNTFMETSVKTLIFSSTSPPSEDTPAEISMDTPDDASSTTSTPPTHTPHQTTPEVLRRIHTILAFYERAIVTQHTPPTQEGNNTLKSNPPNGGDLQSLLLPLAIDLFPAIPHNAPSIHVEPLMPLSTLQQFILRTRRIPDASYQRYCRRLVSDRAIIAERPRVTSPPISRKRARIVGYHDAMGAHIVRYANDAVSREMGGWEFQGEESVLILAVRDYVVLWREGDGARNDEEEVWEETLNEEWDEGMGEDGKGIPVGTRVECDVNGEEEVYTVISAGEDYERDGRYNTDDEPSGGDLRYAIVNDEGRVFLDVAGEKLRGYDATLRVNARERERNASREGSSAPLLRGTGHGFFESRGVPLSTRRGNGGTGDGRGGGGVNATPTVGVLKRTWSALSPLQNMKPLELSIEGSVISEEGGAGGGAVGAIGSSPEDASNRRRAMSVGNEDWDVGVDYSGAMVEAEIPPNLSVEFSLSDNIPTISLPNPEETTLFSGLKCLKHLNHLNVGKQSKLRNNIALERRCKLYYTITMSIPPKKSTPHWNKDATSPSLPATFTPPWSHHTPDVPHNSPFSPHMPALLLSNTCTNLNESRFDPSENTPENTENTAIDVSSSPPLSPNTPFSPAYTFDPHTTLTHCDGLCPTSVQCLELLEILAEHSLRPSTPTPPPPTLPPLFVSTALTSKLLLQLDDPLTVVSGSLPTWTTIAPTLTPRVFSHTSRSLLLERAAFGVSRAAWHQQEAKVAVGPLRQRMAALRGRAVELVGEAFSGGAADPTALQLQADELYGMEEALAARVSAAFRAQRWDERSLQCAKAAVRREELLRDAGKVMERYACDGRVRRRRLEVRFEGESGFDAASGEEAGVTRGFYADVAEALLSCEHVCGVFNPSVCGMEGIMGNELGSRERGVTAVKMRLPLWIPDIDASGKVVIPTPRADSHSVPGVYPRPLASVHPLYGAVLEQFRFMGRLFAAALRDGFIFPLPLSSSFLKLVQTGGGAGVCHPRPPTNDVQRTKNSSRLRSSSSSNSSFASVDYFSNHSNGSVSSASSAPTMKTNMSIEDFCTGSTSNSLVENVNPLVSGSAGRNHVNEPFSPHNNPVSSDSNQSFLLCMAAEQNTPHAEPHSATTLPPRNPHPPLTSLDLPRPGFLAGDIYAVEKYICDALDKLDELKFDLTDEEYTTRKQTLARDRSFARIALGKSYDCSFEEYFEDKCFVDPLDPTQGEDAIPLCERGDRISVTIDNVREWTVLAKKFFLYDGVIAQALSFRRGVSDFFSADALRLFTAEELQRDVCGGGDNVDNWDEKAIRSLFKLDGGKGAAEALVAVAAMGGEGGAALSRRFGPSSPTVGHLVKALLGASSTQRRQFLSFVTSVPIVTPGQIEVVPVVNPAGEFLPMSDPGCLPRANTCARRLYLPKFESYESFSQVLWAVVREESKFKGFYEWRG